MDLQPPEMRRKGGQKQAAIKEQRGQAYAKKLKRDRPRQSIMVRSLERGTASAASQPPKQHSRPGDKQAADKLGGDCQQRTQTIITTAVTYTAAVAAVAADAAATPPLSSALEVLPVRPSCANHLCREAAEARPPRPPISCGCQSSQGTPRQPIRARRPQVIGCLECPTAAPESWTSRPRWPHWPATLESGRRTGWAEDQIFWSADNPPARTSLPSHRLIVHVALLVAASILPPPYDVALQYSRRRQRCHLHDQCHCHKRHARVAEESPPLPLL